MAKVKSKSGLSTVNKILSVVLIVLLIATVIIVATTDVSPATAEAENSAASSSNADEIKIDEFVPGTYGGVEFKEVADVVNYYNECYNYTKTLTASYEEDGEAKTYYKLLGDEHLNVENLLVEGKSNGTINKLVPSIVDGLFSGSVKGLSPSDNRDPQYDSRDDGKIDLKTSLLTVDDVLMANVKEEGGKIVITIQPKGAILSMPCEDSQGRFFNVLGDISSTVEKISVLTFSSGTIDENFVVNYKGGSGTVTIDPATKEITEADYTMNVHIDVQHANVTILKDKNASLDIIYTNHFPADDQYLKDSRKIVRK